MAEGGDLPADQSRLDEAREKELVVYLRNRLCKQEREFSTALFDKLNKSEHERQQLKQSRDELDEHVKQEQHLHDQLVEARVQHFRERELMLDLRMQNDQLRVQELDDRRRIQHLLELARDQERLRQPHVQEITFFRDCRPPAASIDPNSNR
jgi:coiled-coil domain-containing protein 77